jgi:hypothetical protein
VRDFFLKEANRTKSERRTKHKKHIGKVSFFLMCYEIVAPENPSGEYSKKVIILCIAAKA